MNQSRRGPRNDAIFIQGGARRACRASVGEIAGGPV